MGEPRAPSAGVCLRCGALAVPFCFAFALVAVLPMRASTAPLPTLSRLSPAEHDLISSINVQRDGSGDRPLRFSATLSLAARAHANSMAQSGYFSHADRDGTPFWKRLLRYYPDRGYRRWQVGENLYWSHTTSANAAAIVNAWLASPEHRRVLLGEWSQLGVAILHANDAPGIFGDQDVVIAVADFGNRTP